MHMIFFWYNLTDIFSKIKRRNFTKNYTLFLLKRKINVNCRYFFFFFCPLRFNRSSRSMIGPSPKTKSSVKSTSTRNSRPSCRAWTWARGFTVGTSRVHSTAVRWSPRDLTQSKSSRGRTISRGPRRMGCGSCRVIGANVERLSRSWCSVFRNDTTRIQFLLS